MNNFRTNARCRNARYIPAIERRTEVKSVFLNDAVDGAHNGAPIRLALRVSGVGVLAANRSARLAYERAGFRPYEMIYEKTLASSLSDLTHYRDIG